MNLDGDAARERVEATNRVSFDHSYSLARVVFYDVCRGETIEHQAAPEGKGMSRTMVRGSRALGRPGFLFSIRYASGEMIIRVARLRIQQPGECPTPVALFDYSTANPPLPPPSGLLLDGAYLTVGDFSRHYAGRELRLGERYAERPGGRAHARRLTFFRYRKATAQYERYLTTLIEP